jgi:List-Bact-rpt repeat protein
MRPRETASGARFRRMLMIAALVAAVPGGCGDDTGGTPDASGPADAAAADAAAAADGGDPDAAASDAGVTPDAAADAGPPPPGLNIQFAGSALGEVRVETSALVEYCVDPCTLDIPAGETVTITGVTPSSFGGWSGACSGADPTCTFTMPGATISVTVSFEADPSEAWTMLLTAGAVVLSADWDSGGNLILGTSAGLAKLSGGGETFWTVPSLSGTARVGPGDVIYVLSGNTLTKVDTGGDTVWSHTLANAADSCATPTPRQAHTWAVSPNGDIALQRGNALEVWTSAGVPHWTVPDVGPDPRCAVAIDSAGNIASGVRDEVSAEGTALSRYAPDGTPLGIGEIVGSQYTFTMDYDASDTLATSSSGHSHADVERIGVYAHSASVDSASWIHHAVTVDAAGDVTWFYVLDELCGGFGTDNFAAFHYDPAGNQLWSLSKDNDWIPFPIYECNWGFGINDLAASATGRVALVGNWSGPSGSYAWVEVFDF